MLASKWRSISANNIKKLISLHLSFNYLFVLKFSLFYLFFERNWDLKAIASSESLFKTRIFSVVHMKISHWIKCSSSVNESILKMWNGNCSGFVQFVHYGNVVHKKFLCTLKVPSILRWTNFGSSKSVQAMLSYSDIEKLCCFRSPCIQYIQFCEKKWKATSIEIFGKFQLQNSWANFNFRKIS